MGDLGKKGTKGPDRVVAPESGNDNQGQSEGTGPARLQPVHKAGTRGSNKGAR